MSEIIQKWLTDCIGTVLDMSPEMFGKEVMDGTIIGKILYNYKIIGQDQFISIIPTTSGTLAFQNLKKIKLWLDTQKIECSEDDLFEISQQKGSNGIRLFYQLYLALHDKNVLNFNVSKKSKERLHPSDTRFEITPAEEPPNPELEMPDNELCEPLILRNDVVQWNQHRYQMLAEQYDTMRENYTKYIRDKFTVDQSFKQNIPKTKVELPENLEELNSMSEEQSEEFSYEELVEQQQAAIEATPFQEDPVVAKEVLTGIKKRRRREMKEKELKVYQQKLLLMELWEKLVKEQEKEFLEVISKKMLKQSVFEKQMITKMFEVREQKHNLLYNRQLVDDETMKRREQEFLESVFLRDKGITDQKYNYYFERDRALELHRMLYQEKLRLKAERHYNMCRDVMKDFVDVSFRHHDYEMMYGEDPPSYIKREWENLFVKSQPIFDILESVSDLVQDNDDLEDYLEEIYRLEFDRQNKLDEADLENYLNCEKPWLLEELLLEYEEDLIPIQYGMNVLGFNVHKMLLVKYPRPAPPVKPKLPNFKITVCINGLPDVTILPVLQKLLIKRNVRIVELQEAINYCLDVFKEEIKTEYIDVKLIEESTKAVDVLKGKKKKEKSLKKGKKGGKASPKGKKKGMAAASSRDLAARAEKECQTPRLYPCEEIVLSNVGELGKMAYDLLNIGEQLTDSLVVAMFVEFLKTLTESEGWALVNFPTNMVQAALLEEFLTGIPIPGLSNTIKLDLSKSIGDIADLHYRQSQLELEEEYALLRKSKILPDPDPPCYEPPYDSYLTAYINVSHKAITEPKSAPSSPKETIKTEEVKEPPGVELVVEEEEIDPLEKFYADQGCNYAFMYKTFDVATIKHLGKLIIGDYTIPRKTSVELFGETVLYIQANLNQAGAKPGKEASSKKKKGSPKKEKPKKSDKSGGGDAKEKGSKKGKDKKGKKDKKDKKGKKGKKGKSKGSSKAQDGVEIVAVVFEDKETQMPEYYIEEPPEKPPPEIKPGEPLWQYTNIPFPKPVQLALALLWENTEKVYVGDFRELFFIKRIILDAVIPYLTHIRHHMINYIERPDNKQTYLYEFQNLYNEIDPDFREDDELKAELHCRILEFREKLWTICDQTMKESEAERQRLIHDDWAANQICELTNNYLTAMQLEIDRCCDSFQFLMDYYSGVITKMPSDESPLTKTTLTKLDTGNIESLSHSPFGMAAIEEVARVLTVVDSNSEHTTFHELVNTTFETSKQAVAKWKSTCLGIVNKMDAYFKPGKKKKGKDSAKGKKGGKGGKGGDKKLPKISEPDPDVIEAGPRMIQELNCSVNGEALRAKQRLTMIMQRAFNDISDVMNCTKKTFYVLYQNINDRYHTDIENVNTICSVFCQAVEAESPIQPELVLMGDKFYVDPNILLFPEPLPLPEPPACDCIEPGVFSMEQLDKFIFILKDLAPTGSIPERSFIFLLQDMITHKAEDGKESILPELWRNLLSNQISILSRELFGDVEFIDWKDFIIYNYCVSFPTEEQLIEVRDQFCDQDPDMTETVKDYQYFDVRFWFEEEDICPGESDRNMLVKQQLFQLFKVNEDTINYTALLLAFCKDVNPIKGFAKALTLVLGKLVCWNNTIGQIYVKSVLEQRILDYQAEQERLLEEQRVLQISESVVDTLIDTTVHLCDSVIIEDYYSEAVTENPSSVLNVTENGCMEEMYGEGGSFRESDLLLLEQTFSNIEIGYEPTYDPAKAYFLPFDALLTVITASLPWHTRAQTVNNRSFRDRLEVLFEKCKNPEFNDTVLTHELLNDSYFIDMLTSNTKFIVKDPPKLVAKFVKYTGSNVA